MYQNRLLHVCKDVDIKFESRKLLCLSQMCAHKSRIMFVNIHSVSENWGLRACPQQKVLRFALSITLENAPLQDMRCANFTLNGQQKTSIYASLPLCRKNNSKMPNDQNSKAHIIIAYLTTLQNAHV